MANKSISELTAATALQGGELLPVVQSSTTKKSTIKDITNYTISYHLTVSSGQTVDLDSSTYEDVTMIKLSWSGATGSMTLTLPDATSTNNTNRMIRFISNGGFNTSTRVHLTPASGQTLDGSSSHYEINKEYEGIMVWSDGSEWFVIQQKA
jgi:hypothetical protein